jgi:hypothetical protein
MDFLTLNLGVGVKMRICALEEKTQNICAWKIDDCWQDGMTVSTDCGRRNRTGHVREKGN